ncbi:unnamed protein product [Alternaria alternata]
MVLGSMSPRNQQASNSRNSRHTQMSVSPGLMQPPKQPASKSQGEKIVLTSPKFSGSIPSTVTGAAHGENASSRAYLSSGMSTARSTTNVQASDPTMSASQDVTINGVVVVGDDDEQDRNTPSGSDHEDSDGNNDKHDTPSGSEYEDDFFGKALPKQPAKTSNKGNFIPKRLPVKPSQTAELLNNLQYQATAQSISRPEIEKLEDAMLEAEESRSEVTNRVRQLYTLSSNPHRKIDICPGRCLEQLDVLSLLHIKGLERCAWFTDAVILALLALEGPLQADVYTELDFGIFLDEIYVEKSLDEEISRAESGEMLEFGFPFQDVTSNHARIMGVINPSGIHWLTFEFVLGTRDSLPTLFYYNSVQHPSQRGPSYKAVKDTLPKLLHLASLQPNSPLAGLEAKDVLVKEVDCPQQAGDHECGPMSIFCYTRRLYNLPVSVDLPRKIDKREFGEWTRSECVGRLVDEKKGISCSLGRRFADPLPTFGNIESLRKDNDRRLYAALNYLRAADCGDDIDKTIDCHVEVNLIRELEEARNRYDVQPYDIQLNNSVRELLAELAAKSGRIMRAICPEGFGDADAAGSISNTGTNISSASKTRIDVRLSKADTKTVPWTHPITGELMEGTVGELPSSTVSAPMYRIEMGVKGPDTTSIIAVMRYSCRSHMWKTHVHDCKIKGIEPDLTVLYREEMGIAAKWADMYMRSVADTGPAHLIIYAGTRLQTFVLPAVGHDMYDNAEYRGPACPVCSDYDVWKLTGQHLASELTEEFKTHVAKVHIRGNEVPVEKPTTGKYYASCNWPGCKKKVEGAKPSTVTSHILRHQVGKHIHQWLKEQLGKIRLVRGSSSPPPQLPTISTSQDTETASGVSRTLQFIIGEYVFTRRCSYCPDEQKFSNQENFRLHQYETHAAPVDAEFRCDYKLFTPEKLGENWENLPRALKSRMTLLLAETENRCPCGDSVTACRQLFNTPAELLRHCDKVHAKEPALWSMITENQCGLAFASHEELRNHTMICHENVIASGRNDWSAKKPTREIEWTRAITMDLDELAQSTTTPVLLSIGADGFTCNPLLMSEWLKQRGRNFIFAVTHDNESTLDTEYLTPVGESYVTTYDLRILSRQPSEKGDPRHVDLVNYWDRLQSTKDGVSKNIRPRNQVPRDKSTKKRD